MRVLWLVFTFPNGYMVVCFFRNNISFGVHKERPEIIKCFLPDPRLSKNIAALLKWHRAVSSYKYH
jgi:hypothetical protein